ncbi:penicillin-binding protein 1C [Microbulbifer sp. OS29]|uniref:peptidoglycan glycosyltransferase n=1 Tax=Microbulbifer okhotskensis TaxID=2926617 RepID=A0A9X2ESF4_9GAMM|nr:penicillin-binding protein 1C [Microbulbifer okhotskensis]MCO1334773.1 penicillin-binding protein 1C [Microbulbifer okhotskensis]
MKLVACLIGAWQRSSRKFHALLLTPVVLLGALLLLDFIFPPPLPKEQDFARVVADRHGKPLRFFAGSRGVWRYPIGLEEVSPRFIEALLTYEDRHFYHHPGVNPLALLRAGIQYIRSGQIVSGGSTLTMQVARLLDPHRKTLPGKAKQMLRALQLEWHFSKREILELYLNLAPYGGNIEGVEAASRLYLRKSAADLTHAEAALLAVLPQAPSRLRPDRHPQRAQKARGKVLSRLRDFGIWSKNQVDRAELEKVYAERLTFPQNAPHLARRLVETISDREVIRTTIDGSIQRGLEDFLRDHIDGYPQKTSAAIVVLENSNLSVRAYVGASHFGDARRYGYVDMARAVRSPGSTLKPFLYGLAIDTDLIHSASLLSDAPRIYGDYRPENFHRGFSGPVSATAALQRSLNVPAVQLLEHYGPGRFAATLENAGLSLQFPIGGKPNLSMVLGGVGTRLDQLTGIYAGLARGGQAAAPRYLPNAPLRERYLMSPEAAWITFEMLASNRAGSRRWRNLVRQTKADIAWKTGTSYGYRDAWAIGVTPSYTVGVWVGRPDGTPLPGYYGSISATPLLNAVIAVLPGNKQQHLTKPESLTQEAICWPLGGRKTLTETELCHQQHNAWLIQGRAPKTLPPRGEPLRAAQTFNFFANPQGQRVKPSCMDTRAEKRSLALWPKELESWLPANQTRAQLIPPTAPECGAPAATSGTPLKIIGAGNGNQYRPTGNSAPLPHLNLSAIGGQGRRYWFLNGKPQGETLANQNLELKPKNGKHQIAVLDASGNVDRIEIFVGTNN